MSKRHDLRRLRPWEMGLAALAVAGPFLLPAIAPQAPAFMRSAIAQEMQSADTSRLVSIGGAVTEII